MSPPEQSKNPPKPMPTIDEDKIYEEKEALDRKEKPLSENTTSSDEDPEQKKFNTAVSKILQEINVCKQQLEKRAFHACPSKIGDEKEFESHLSRNSIVFNDWKKENKKFKEIIDQLDFVYRLEKEITLTPKNLHQKAQTIIEKRKEKQYDKSLKNLDANKKEQNKKYGHHADDPKNVFKKLSKQEQKKMYVELHEKLKNNLEFHMIDVQKIFPDPADNLCQRITKALREFIDYYFSGVDRSERKALLQKGRQILSECEAETKPATEHHPKFH